MLYRKMIPCRTKEAILVVTDYHDGIMTGMLEHPRMRDPMKICSMSQLLLVLDSLLDLEECPDHPLPLVKPVIEETVLATFQIQVLFRECCTWQGKLLWKEMEREVSFRSVLELMQLLDEILGT